MIKASQLIAQLQKAIAEKGDLPVVIHTSGFGGYGINVADSAKLSSIGTYDIEESISTSLWKELFPETPEPEDGDEPEDVSVDCIEIKAGETIYTT